MPPDAMAEFTTEPTGIVVLQRRKFNRVTPITWAEASKAHYAEQVTKRFGRNTSESW